MTVSPYWLFGLVGLLFLGGAELRADDDWQRVWQETQTFKQDCAVATTGEMPPLIERFGRIEDSSYTKGRAFIALAEAWFRLQPLPAKAVFSSEETPLPPLPEGFPDELIAALRHYQEVNAPFEKLSASALKGESKIDFQAHEADYWKLLIEMLTGQGGPFTERVLAFRWGHWCGTGSERFYAPQSRAILMALLQDQRWSEAAGASLAARPDGPMRGTARVLSSLVSDPVVVVAGGLAFQSLPPHDYYKRQGMTGLLGLMAVLPGDERVRLLTMLVPWIPPDSRRDYYRVLGKFVPIVEDPNSDGSAERWMIGDMSGDNLDELVAERVDEKGQALALDFLCSQATASLPVEAAQELVRVFRPKRHPVIRSALRRLLEHPSATVATEAATALAERGEKVEIPAKLGPVRYQLTINGQPYAGRRVSWTVQKKEGSTSSEVTTSAEGVAELSRDDFLDGTIEGVALRSVEMADLLQPWFSILLPAPPPTNDLHPANVETMRQTLHLDLPRPDADLAGQTMEIVLWGAQDAKNQRLGFWMPVKFSLPAARKIVLPNIQRGTYRLEIRIPGFTTWNDAFEVGASEKLTLPFQRARDVRLTVQPPSGWNEFSIIPELWKNGKRISTDWDYEKHLFRGVSVGAYTLHLPSSAEVRKRVHFGLPDGPEFSGADIPFEVTSENPQPLDLGVIPLEKVSP